MAMGDDPILHNDPNGDIALWDNIVGAVVGAALGYGEQVATNWVQGKANPFISNINITSIVTSGAVGFLTSGENAIVKAKDAVSLLKAGATLATIPLK